MLKLLVELCKLLQLLKPVQGLEKIKVKMSKAKIVQTLCNFSKTKPVLNGVK